MKKLLLLFILAPFTAFAEFYPGSVFMENGTELSGFIKEPTDGDEQTLKFKIKEDSQTLSLEINNVKGFEYRDDENENVRYITAYFTSPSILEVSIKKAWFKVEKEGSLILCSKLDSNSGYAFAATNGKNINFDSKVNGSTGGERVDAPGGYGMSSASEKRSSSSSTTTYFIKRNKDNALSYLGPVGTANWFTDLKSVAEDFFKDCPNLVASLDKTDLKKNGLERIVDLYQQNCGTNTTSK